MAGKNVLDIPPKTYEAIFVCVTGWTIEYIRNLPEPDFKGMAQMILNKFINDSK